MCYCCLRIDAQQHRAWRHRAVKHLARAIQALEIRDIILIIIRRHAHGRIERHVIFPDAIPNDIAIIRPSIFDEENSNIRDWISRTLKAKSQNENIDLKFRR